MPRRFFLPVSREDLDRYLHCQDNIADGVEDLAVILVIRKTHVHEQLVPSFLEIADQVIQVGNTMISAAEELVHLAETSFEGAEAERILALVSTLGEEEWKADRLQKLWIAGFAAAALTLILDVAIGALPVPQPFAHDAGALAVFPFRFVGGLIASAVTYWLSRRVKRA